MYLTSYAAVSRLQIPHHSFDAASLCRNISICHTHLATLPARAPVVEDANDVTATSEIVQMVWNAVIGLHASEQCSFHDDHLGVGTLS